MTSEQSETIWGAVRAMSWSTFITAVILVAVLASAALAQGDPQPGGIQTTIEMEPPLLFLERLTTMIEIAMLIFGAQLFLCAIDLAVMRRFRLAAAFGVASLPVVIAGIAVPGSAILINSNLFTEKGQTSAFAFSLLAAWILVTILVAAFPCIVSVKRNQSGKRKKLVFAFATGSIVVPIVWPVAVHFAFAD